jgi:hypothetical protein
MHYFFLIFGLSLQQPQIASFSAAHLNIFVLIEILLGSKVKFTYHFGTQPHSQSKEQKKKNFYEKRCLVLLVEN